ncbi:MAG: hypothetical protein ACKVQK_26840 [Burkholderiales bacterium]
MGTRFKFIVLLFIAALSGCVAVQPLPPRIERLPENVVLPTSVAPASVKPLSLAEVAEMARNGTPANVIIQSLRDSRAAYAITSTEASDLSRQGVPYEVVEYLRFGERQAVAAYPVYPVHPVPRPFYPYSGYAPYVVVPGIYFSRGFYGPYPRYPRSGFSLRFGFRR